MNEFFNIADRTELISLEKEIGIREIELEEMKENLAVLKKDTFDTFCGKKIIKNKVNFIEYVSRTVPHYSIIIELHGRKIEANVHVCNGEETFTVSCSRWDRKQSFEQTYKDITEFRKYNLRMNYESFDEAKICALKML